MPGFRTVPHPPPTVADVLTPEIVESLHDHIERLHHVTATSAAYARRGALAVPVTASGRLHAAAGTLAGWSVHDTGGAGALVRLRDGTDAAGDILAVIDLAAGASETRWLLPHGIGFVGGLYLEVASGAVEGAVHTGPWA